MLGVCVPLLFTDDRHDTPADCCRFLNHGKLIALSAWDLPVLRIMVVLEA
jgi:hypothetical protein